MAKFEWIQPALGGVAVGAIGLAIVGFAWGGWVTGGSSTQAAEALSETRVVAALTPYCVAKAQADPQVTERLVELKAASSYNRSELVMKNGWATLAGQTDPDRAVANGCQKALVS